VCFGKNPEKQSIDQSTIITRKHYRIFLEENPYHELTFKRATMTDTPISPEYLLSARDIANILGLKSENTVRKWYYAKTMPEPDIKGHKFLRWRATTISEFLKDPESWRAKNL